MTNFHDALAQAGLVRKPASQNKPQQVLIVVSRQDAWADKAPVRREIKCYNCGMNGHVDRDCRFPKR